MSDRPLSCIPAAAFQLHISRTMDRTVERTVLVCQNTVCRKQGSPKVLKALEAQVSEAVSVTGSGCLGQCGSGPTVLILPEQTWCLHVQPYLVPSVIKQHLEGTGDEASTGRSGLRIWLWLLGLSTAITGLVVWILAQQTAYF